MKILYYSEKESEKYLSKNAWVRGCSNIKYYPSSVTREESDTKKYYCLSFEYENPYNFDKVNFAYSYPYTSLDL